MRFSTSVVSSIALLSGAAVAHPGHDLTQEIAERRAFLGSVKRADLSHCAAKLKARGVQQRNIARRAALVNHHREKRKMLQRPFYNVRVCERPPMLTAYLGGLKKRDAATVLATSHNSTDLGYTLNTDAATLFAGNNSCVLTPEVTQGPYCKLNHSQSEHTLRSFH
jgi:hypothetical protein